MSNSSSTIPRQRVMGQYMTPASVADLMVATMKRAPASWRVLDPACGDGNLLLAVARHLAAAGVSDVVNRIAGIDIDPAMLACARHRLSEQLDCDPGLLRLWHGDFLDAVQPSLLEGPPLSPADFNVIISNPPYGRSREYLFFEAVCRHFRKGTELVFLVPLAFLDRVEGVWSAPLDGRPLGVTTGHAIVHHVAGAPFRLNAVRRYAENSTPFSVLSGVKLYEIGAGVPPQSEGVVKAKPFSTDSPKPGWIPCVRTGDIHPYQIEMNRMWVRYGDHLAHPKDLERFTGPRLFVRRMPIWSTRQLGAAYVSDQALCAGDVLVVRHIDDDPVQLRGLCVFLNSPEAAEFILDARPSVRHRDSYPKISGKDLNRLLDSRLPDRRSLAKLAHEYDDRPEASGAPSTRPVARATERA